MEIFKGYVLQAELAKKAKVSLSLFRQLKDIKFKKMGHLTCIKKDSLPKKYQKIANQCTDLEFYMSFSYLAQGLGMCKDYLSVLEKYNNYRFTSLKICHVRLFKLNDLFIEKLSKGLNAFKIRLNDEELAEEHIVMQNIKIGFY